VEEIKLYGTIIVENAHLMLQLIAHKEIVFVIMVEFIMKILIHVHLDAKLENKLLAMVDVSVFHNMEDMVEIVDNVLQELHQMIENNVYVHLVIILIHKLEDVM
jgi:hypothetical protein